MEERSSWVVKVLSIVPFFVVLAFSLFAFFYITPEDLLTFVGIENAYLLMFTVSLLGGLTTLNTVPYYSILILLVGAGLSPLLVGCASAGGVMVGDSVSYFVGHQGARAVPLWLRGAFASIHTLVVKHPRWFPVVCFVYGSLSPLSNDLLTIPAGMARIPYVRVMIPLALGNLVFNIALAYLAVHGLEWIQSLFL